MYRAQIVLLKIQIERLHKQISKLVRLIREIKTYTFEVYHESDSVVKKRSGVKRAVYAWHKARWEVAVKVLKIIRNG